MLELTPLVEPISIDEAFLDLAGTAAAARHERRPRRWRALPPRSRRRLGITVSIGLARQQVPGQDRLRSRQAARLCRARQAEAAAFLADKPVQLHLRRRQGRRRALAKDGFHRSPICSGVGESELIRRYGAEGQRLARLARGIDDRAVDPVREAKERVGGKHLRARHRLVPAAGEAAVGSCGGGLGRLKDKRARRLDRDAEAQDRGLPHPAPGRARSRARPSSPARFSPPRATCSKREIDGTRYRLLGVGVSALVDADDADPADLIDGRAAIAEHAVDRVRARFGDGAVIRGLAFEGPEDT